MWYLFRLAFATTLSGAIVQELEPFERWLQTLAIDVPQGAHNITLPTGGILKLQIISGNCQNFAMNNVDVDETIGIATLFATKFSIAGLGIQCHLSTEATLESSNGSQFEYSHGMESELTTGQLDIDFSLTQASVGLALQLDIDSNKSSPLPRSSKLNACSLGLQRDSISLHLQGKSIGGRLIAMAIDGADGIIKPWLPKLVNTTICAAGQYLIDKMLSAALAGFESDGAFDRMLPLTEDPMTDRAVNLQEMFVDGVMGHVLQSLLHDGGLLNYPTPASLSAEFGKVLNMLLPQSWFSYFSEGVVLALPLGIGTLEASSSLADCRTPGYFPSPLASGYIDNHTMHIALGSLTGGCRVELNIILTLNPSFVKASKLDLSMRLTGDISNASGGVSLMLGLNKDQFNSHLGIDQLAHFGCLQQFLDSFGSSSNASVKLLDFDAHLGDLQLQLSSDRAAEPLLDALLRAVASWATGAMASFLPAVLLLLQGGGGLQLRTWLNSHLNELLTGPKEECPVSEFKAIDHPVANAMSRIGAAVFGAVGLLASFPFVAFCVLRCLRQIDKRGNNLGTERPTVVVGDRQHRGPVASHPAVMKTESAALVLFALADLCLFAYAMLALFLKLDVAISDENPQGGGSNHQVMENIVDINYVYLVRLMFSVGLWYIGLALMGLCVIHPLGVLSILACWFAGPRLVPHSYRAMFFKYIALVSKLNLLVPFIIVLMVMPMVLALDSSTADGGKSKFVAGVELGPGAYVWVLSVVAVLLIGEMAMRLNCRAEAFDQQRLKMVDDVPNTLEVVHLDQSHKGTLISSSVKKSPLCIASDATVMTKTLTTLMLLAAPVLLATGMVMADYKAKFAGLVGVLNFAIGRDEEVTWSVATIVMGFPWPVKDDLVMKVGTCLFVLFLAWFTLLAPLLHNISLLTLWFMPLTPKRRMSLAQTEYFLHCWQGIELFCVCFCAMVILGDNIFRALGLILNRYSTLKPVCGLLEAHDMLCIDIKIGGCPGLWYLIAGVLLHVGGTVLLRLQVWKGQASRGK